MSKKAFTLIELMIVVAIIGLLAAIAIPNFVKFQSRAKMAEVKSNLKTIFSTQKAIYQEKDRYIAEVNVMGFAPERGNRYTYYTSGSAAGTLQPRSTPALDTSNTTYLGIEADTFRFDTTTGIVAAQTPAMDAVVVTTNNGYFFATAAGNVDRDNAYDQWSIGSLTREFGASTTALCGAGNNPAGEPCHDVDDLTSD